jgi:transposase
MNFEEIIQNQHAEIQSLKTALIIAEKRCEQYAQAYEQMHDQLKELIRNRFGKKSERYIDPEHPQINLLGDSGIFAAKDEEGNKIADEIEVRSHTRKKTPTSKKDIPIRIEIIPVSEADKKCECGTYKEVISYEIKKLINYQPAVLEIIEQRREIVVCKECNSKGFESKVVTAPAPLHILPKVKASEEFLSFLVVSKIDDRQPLYHLEKQLGERYNIDCSRQTMARWLIDLMFPLQPIYNLIKDVIIEYDIASCDATTLQVLDEPDRSPETKSYAYCMRGGPPEQSVILYEYNDRLHKKFVLDWFEGFEGYLHVDGDNFFELIGDDSTSVDLVNCNSHARRKFEPIAQGAKGKGIAKEAMRFFKELYKIEREAKDKQMTPEQRFQLRQEKSKPLMDKFKEWLDSVYPTVLPQSALGKAINYCLKLWPGLIRFLDDGRLEVDNNLTEQSIKPFVIARKNFLFCASVDGAKALCMHFSLIQTAKKHGLDPYHYYVALLKSIPHCQSIDDYEKLLPWNIKLNYVRQG